MHVHIRATGASTCAYQHVIVMLPKSEIEKRAGNTFVDFAIAHGGSGLDRTSRCSRLQGRDTLES